jgi:hypothetical protein
MSKVYAGLLVAIALIAMAAIGTLALVVVTDVGYLAYRVLKPGMNPERGAIMSNDRSASRQACPPSSWDDAEAIAAIWNPIDPGWATS